MKTKTEKELKEEIEDLEEELGSWCESCGEMFDSKDEWKIKKAQLKTLQEYKAEIKQAIEELKFIDAGEGENPYYLVIAKELLQKLGLGDGK